jgi:electron transport complex protein RnfG
MSLKKTENIIVLGIFLGVIGAISAGILSWVANITREPIEAMKLAKTNQALKEVLPEFDNEPAADKMTIKSFDGKHDIVFFGAKKNGKLIAVAGQGEDNGYSGPVEAMVGLDADGKVRTVIITKQSETPGLGTVVCGRKRKVTIFDLLGIGKKQDANKLPPNPILDQFDGHIAKKGADPWMLPWKVKKDGGNANYITGATISSRAVTKVVYMIAHTYVVKKKEIDAELMKPKSVADDKSPGGAK